LRAEIGKVIVGNDEIVEGTLIATFAGGHVLLEGVPGLGKTLLVRTLSEVLELTSTASSSRRPDAGRHPGTNLVLRIPMDVASFSSSAGQFLPHHSRGRNQSRDAQDAIRPAGGDAGEAGHCRRRNPSAGRAVLRAGDPESHRPGRNLSTARSPTRPLFFQAPGDLSSAAELTEVLNRTTENVKPHIGKVLDGAGLLELQKLVREVPVASHVKDYAVRLVMATHPKTDTAAAISNQYLRFGSSPRARQALILAGKVRALTQGRFNVSFDDIQSATAATLRHRLILNFEAEAEGVTTDLIIAQILKDVPGTLRRWRPDGLECVTTFDDRHPAEPG